MSNERRLVPYTRGTPVAPNISEIFVTKDALYKILGVEPTATQEQIHRAYLRQQLRLHPDKNIGNNDEERLRDELNQVRRAHDILYDPKKRRIYDKYGIDAVSFSEEHRVPDWMLWFPFSRAGRIFACLVLSFSCCFCCGFCCCGCFCNCCCNHCCRADDEENGYMQYATSRENQSGHTSTSSNVFGSWRAPSSTQQSSMRTPDSEEPSHSKK